MYFIYFLINVPLISPSFLLSANPYFQFPIDTSWLSLRYLQFAKHRSKVILAFSEGTFPSVLCILVNVIPLK